MNSIEIHTKRLILRPLSLKYLETVYEYASDIENTKYMVHLPNENIEEISVFLHKVEDEWTKEDPEFFEFAIIYENNQIGAVSVSVENGLGELGMVRTGEYGGEKNKASDDERREYRYELIGNTREVAIT